VEDMEAQQGGHSDWDAATALTAAVALTGNV
jgi:hypothetical protein